MNDSAAKVEICPIKIYDFGEIAGSDTLPEIGEFWPFLKGLLNRCLGMNTDESAIRRQQHGMLAFKTMSMPSPWSATTEDVCDCSYFMDHKFFFEFTNYDEVYYWISGALDDAYRLSALYFPQRRLAFSLYNRVVDAAVLDRFDRLRARTIKPPVGEPCIVMGFPHFMHMLWNELPALEDAAGCGLLQAARVAAMYEPFGPTEMLFPEAADRASYLRFDGVDALNAEHRLLVGLGSWTITGKAQLRLQRTSRELASLATIGESRRFRAAHHPVVWLSIKSPKRTLVDQAQVLAGLITGLRASYPNAGIILNGTSSPWDGATNKNNGHWLNEAISRATDYCQQVIEEVLSTLDADLAKHVKAVSGVAVPDEIVWGGIADFYVCHGGTMQNKIGWTHRIPGFIHSTAAFTAAFKTTRWVDDGPRCFFPPAGLFEDGPIELYSDFELPRGDRDYRCLDIGWLVREVTAAMNATLPAVTPVNVGAVPSCDQHADDSQTGLRGFEKGGRDSLDGVAALIIPHLDALMWTSRRPDQASAWHGHVAFAHWLVDIARPRLVVELGTEHGVSFTAFCHGIAARALPSRSFAVDTWRGDDHTGSYSEEVFASLNDFIGGSYAGFATLLRMTFDEALDLFEPGTIDLLHIDGLHTYEAVKHDFDTWLPKMSDRGIVLFHDTTITYGTFGVWRLWAELQQRYPSFSFEHSAGLGVLLVGANVPPAVLGLCAITEDAQVGVIRRTFEVMSQAARDAGATLNRAIAAEQRSAQLTATITAIKDQILQELP